MTNSLQSPCSSSPSVRCPIRPFGPSLPLALLHKFLALPDKQVVLKLNTYMCRVLLTLAQTLPLTEDVHPLKHPNIHYFSVLRENEVWPHNWTVATTFFL